jgi:hypothetical protein
MIEILVSAIILVTVSLAVFSTLSNADTAAGNQQVRSLAANLAQSKIESVRSLPVEDIQGLPATSTVRQDNRDYTINLVTKWVSDGQDEPECTSQTGGVDYMRITVSVTWNGMGRQTRPVSLTSLFTPTQGSGGGDTGSVSVHLTDRNGDPTVGVPVSLTGTPSYSAVTNVNGCVVFAFIPAVQYTVSFQKAGYVNENSINAPTDTVTVTGGETSKLAYTYDNAGYSKATFKTHFNALGDDRPTSPFQLGLFHAGRTSGSPLIIDQSGLSDTDRMSWTPGTTTPLFPFSTPYAVFGGQCATNVVPAGNPNQTGVNISPGATQNAGTVWLPSLDVIVRDGSSLASPGNIVPNATVQFDSGCGVWTRYTINAPATQILPSNTAYGLVYPGHLADTGFPYAPNGKVCASSAARKSAVLNQTLTQMATTTPLTIYLGAVGSSTANSARTCM